MWDHVLHTHTHILLNIGSMILALSTPKEKGSLKVWHDVSLLHFLFHPTNLSMVQGPRATRNRRILVYAVL